MKDDRATQLTIAKSRLADAAWEAGQALHMIERLTGENMWNAMVKMIVDAKKVADAR